MIQMSGIDIDKTSPNSSKIIQICPNTFRSRGLRRQYPALENAEVEKFNLFNLQMSEGIM